MVFRNKMVVNPQADDDQHHHDETGKSHHAIQEVVAAQGEIDDHARHRIDGAMHHRSHDHRLGLQHEIQLDDAHEHTERHHQQHAPSRLVRVVVPHQNQWEMPEAPHDADKQSCRPELVLPEGVDQIVGCKSR